jgi:hypothetical protein
MLAETLQEEDVAAPVKVSTHAGSEASSPLWNSCVTKDSSRSKSSRSAYSWLSCSERSMEMFIDIDKDMGDVLHGLPLRLVLEAGM